MRLQGIYYYFATGAMLTVLAFAKHFAREISACATVIAELLPARSLGPTETFDIRPAPGIRAKFPAHTYDIPGFLRYRH